MKRLYRVLWYIFMVLLSVPLLAPYLWLLLSSMSRKVLFGFVPTGFTTAHWRFLWAEVPYGLGTLPNIWPVLLNTLIVAVGVATLTTVACGLGGYALSQYAFPGRRMLIQSMLLLRAFPALLLLVATFYILHVLKLLDTLLAVVLVRTSAELVMGTWIIKGFFDDLPKEVSEAAYLDGATEFQVWSRIVLPLVKPGLVAVSIIAFIGGWSDFIFVYMFLFDRSKWTLSVFLYELIGGFEALDYNLLAAISLFYALPVLILYIIFQQAFMRTTVTGME